MKRIWKDWSCTFLIKANKNLKNSSLISILKNLMSSTYSTSGKTLNSEYSAPPIKIQTPDHTIVNAHPVRATHLKTLTKNRIAAAGAMMSTKKTKLSTTVRISKLTSGIRSSMALNMMTGSWYGSWLKSRWTSSSNCCRTDRHWSSRPGNCTCRMRNWKHCSSSNCRLILI